MCDRGINADSPALQQLNSYKRVLPPKLDRSDGNHCRPDGAARGEGQAAVYWVRLVQGKGVRGARKVFGRGVEDEGGKVAAMRNCARDGQRLRAGTGEEYLPTPMHQSSRKPTVYCIPVTASSVKPGTGVTPAATERVVNSKSSLNRGIETLDMTLRRE